MNKYNIQDLKLFGVQWEITDVPMALRAKWGTGNATNQVKTINNDVSSNGTIVPPITPIGTISVEDAVSMAARPTDIDNLIRMISEFNHPLRPGATNFVGPHIAKTPNGLVIITDVPGADDDSSGCVMSGGAGDLLDKMLSAIGMNRDMVSIVPIVFWRTPGGRSPTDSELALVRPFIDRLLEFLHPTMILTLGGVPAKEFADIQLSRNHGKVCKTCGEIPVMPIYHPNYLLLKPSAKRIVWTALQELQKLLKNQ